MSADSTCKPRGGGSQCEPITRFRIAHSVHSLELGGAQQVIKYLVANGDNAAFEHRVYAGKSGVMHAELATAGARIEVITRHIPKFDPLWALRLARALRSARIDLLHTHLFGDSLHGVIAAQLAGAIPVVVTIHNSLRDFSRLQRAGYKWLLPKAACVVACAESAGVSFRDLVGAAGPAIEVIPNGLDPAAVPESCPESFRAAREALGLPADAVVVGSLGRLVPQKNFSLLIEGFRRLTELTQIDVRLVVAGDGPEAALLRAQVQASGLEPRVVLAGFRSDARQLLAGFDVLAFSSRYEGLPMTLLEGMAAGRCVVASAAPGLAEVIADGVDGLLARPSDAASLADALYRAVTDPALRSRVGESARQTFTARYTVERMVSRYESLYREIRERRRKLSRETPPAL